MTLLRPICWLLGHKPIPVACDCCDWQGWVCDRCEMAKEVEG